MTTLLETLQAIPAEHSFSLGDYYRMGELEFFLDDRVELIDGKVISMPPQGNRHDVAIALLQNAFEKHLGDDFWIRVQMSIDLNSMSAPEPDVAIVIGPAAASKSKPRSAMLVIEVSETTLKYDRGTKARLYASNGIADYWILNLIENQLEVYRTPVADPRDRFTHRYADAQFLKSNASIAPLAIPNVIVTVAKLFPPILDAG